jgi:hypothetical protein
MAALQKYVRVASGSESRGGFGTGSWLCVF